jgi:GABA permease
MKSETRTELMAIPIVAIVFAVGIIFLAASVAGAWAWVLIGAGALGLLGILAVHYSRRNPHSSLSSPAPETLTAQPVDDTYRVLVIADESCVDPGFPAQIAAHANGRTIEVLVIAPAIGSWLARWTGDESAHVDARKHLDDTVTALARAGITAMGETGADDPIQATDDGLREFAANEIVFVTKPGTDTDWVEEGVIETAKQRYDIPVTHIALSAA